MSSEVYTFKGELEQLEEKERTLKQKHKELRDFILSDEFLTEKERFETLLSDFEGEAISLVEALEAAPPVIIQEPGKTEGTVQPAQPSPEQIAQIFASIQRAPKTTHVLAMAVLAAVTIIVAGIVELMYPEFLAKAGIALGYKPGELLKWVAISVSIVMALPWIIEALQKALAKALEKKKQEEEIPKELSVDWIHSNLERIRQKYLSAWLLAKVQNQTKEDLPQYEGMGMDEILFSRIKFLKATLSTEFLSVLGKIVIACDRSIWIRKGLLFSAIVQSRAAIGRLR
ncbi:MAG: hypothetical protein ACTSXC_06895 [Candidatus Freyarchaeota archaeon]